jgi:uncharacterized membrane protein
MRALSPPAERYLRDMDRCLSAIPEAEREEIVAEIRSYLLDRADAAAHPVQVLGPPAEYAASFVHERALAGALVKGTSWALGRALVTGVGRLTWWYVVAVLALAHVYGAVLVALAALKPVFPRHIGVFVGDHFVVGAMLGSALVGREVIGWWAIPFFLVPGVFILWGGNFVLRVLVRWRLTGVTRTRTQPSGATA